jgi:hypothetical protein
MTTLYFRALCAELLQECKYLHNNNCRNEALWDRAYAALAQPGGEGPSDDAWWHELVSEIARVQNVAAGEGQGPRFDLAEAVVRWCHPAPPAPESGEVSEIAAELLFHVAFMHSQDKEGWPVDLDLPPLLTRAADLLQQLSAPAPAAVPVSERLPEPNVKVLAYYVNALGNGRTICAIWVPAKTRSDSGDECDFTEYDEETDTLYWPEGWYEQIENWEDLGWVRVYEGEVIYWQALPKWPACALPSSSVLTELENSND